MTHDIQSSEWIANFNTKWNFKIENISGNSVKDKVRATPMTKFTACPECSNVPDVDFISCYWVLSENTSENEKNSVEVKTAGSIRCGNGENTMAKRSVGNLNF